MSNATLHNEDEINRKVRAIQAIQSGIGVPELGDVIPQLNFIRNKINKKKTIKNYFYPTTCLCGAKTRIIFKQ